MATTSITGAFDAVVVYQFIKILATPWEEQEAFKLGIIDENGKTLKKRKTLKSQEEKNAFTVFHVLVFNLKRILERVPFGKTRLASFAAALLLLREERDLESMSEEELEKLLMNMYEDANVRMAHLKYLSEETTTANIAGLDDGHGPVPGLNTASLGTRSSFAGHTVFVVDGERFSKARLGKKRYARWATYVGEDNIGSEIKEYGKKNPKAPIILQHEATGAMLYLRYGK
jgi:hypothetical protein